MSDLEKWNLADLFRKVWQKEAVKDSTPNIVTAMSKFYICHRQDIFSHRLKAPKFSRYDATAGMSIPTKQCAEILLTLKYSV